jgi:hypothetical protein
MKLISIGATLSTAIEARHSSAMTLRATTPAPNSTGMTERTDSPAPPHIQPA